MSKIYDRTVGFSLVRGYVRFTFKRFYSEFIVVGKENIPTDSPIIFAPNHVNALMDALVVHTIAPNNLPVIFLARSDIFKNKVAAKLLSFAKIMPAFRMRDGIENLGKNNEVFDKCVEVLLNKGALGIMPEGNQEIERKLRPLVKGIFRIAFAAQQKLGANQKVKILPIGIDYVDIVKSNKPIVINIGKPIVVSEYMTSFSQNPVAATNEIKEKLRIDLNELTLNLDTENYYECFEAVVEIANKPIMNDLGLKDNPLNRFKARQIIAERLIETEKNELGKIKVLDSLRVEYSESLKSLKIRNADLEYSEISLIRLLFEGVITALTLPFFVVGLILNFLPFFAPVYVRKNIFKTQYEGFFSSLQFAIGLITFPVFYLLQTLLFGLFVTNNWWVVLLFFLMQYPMGKLSLKSYKMIRKFIAKIHFRRLKRTKSEAVIELQDIRNQIISLVSNF